MGLLAAGQQCHGSGAIANGGCLKTTGKGAVQNFTYDGFFKRFRDGISANVVDINSEAGDLCGSIRGNSLIALRHKIVTGLAHL